MTPRPADLARTLVARALAATAAQERRAADLRDAIRAAAVRLRSQGTIEAAWLVGSLAWGGFGAHSDVDVIVRGANAAALGGIWSSLVDAATPHVGENVDVLPFETLPASFQDRVLAEGQRLDDG